MKYTKSTSHFRSSGGNTDITYYIYEPTCTIRAILQVCHGMYEYLDRYQDFIQNMTSHGILVCGNDHLGHGNSIKSMDDLGQLSEEKGWQNLVLDVKHLTDLIQKNYPSIPIFIFGHSMGSFLLRAYLTQYGSNLYGVIMSGTSGFNPAAGFGEFLIKRIYKRKGPLFRSKSFHRIMFGGFNKYFMKDASVVAWLTRDKTIVEKYINDSKCNFVYTTNGFLNIIKLQRFVTSKVWANKIPKQVPILLISGDMDPVGNYGKGVKQTYRQLKQAGVESVSIKLYKDGRHEMHNELNKEDVYKDVIDWMNQFI